MAKKVQAVLVAEATYEDAMRYRQQALKNNDREAAWLAIMNFRIWVKATALDIIQKGGSLQGNKPFLLRAGKK